MTYKELKESDYLGFYRPEDETLSKSCKISSDFYLEKMNNEGEDIVRFGTFVDVINDITYKT